MARTEAEKYGIRRYQDRTGRWHNERELIHDARYCDLCDSEDVEQPSDLVTVNGWYGGIEILWSGRGGVHGPNIVAVMCRSCRQQHDDAYWNAERRPVDVIDDFAVFRAESAYYCPAHKADHYEDRMDVEQREAAWSETRGILR